MLYHINMSNEIGDVQERPSVLKEDNDTARRNMMGLVGKPSEMRHASQLIGFIQHHVQEGTITVNRVDSAALPADGLTKVKGPTGHWASTAPQLLGWSKELEAMQELVRHKYGRRTAQQWEEADQDRAFERQALSVEARPGLGFRDQRSAHLRRREMELEAFEEQDMSDQRLCEEDARRQRAREAQVNRQRNAASAMGPTPDLRRQLRERREAGAQHQRCPPGHEITTRGVDDDARQHQEQNRCPADGGRGHTWGQNRAARHNRQLQARFPASGR
jgi:hypothetical protein